MNSAAVAAALEAAYIQSGVSAKADALRRYVEARARRAAEVYHVEKHVTGALLVYHVYKTRRIEIPLAPNKKLRIYEDKVEVEVTW